ncbi:Uncharacterized HTH-type transcriptional regulator yybR [Slackia heliotrinireducens]|uniref:Predicted transcriptional regulator n=1 Tax=Slackia heliotrinireducens (strain ATCC 29202 / DSM 20476 / NCTC 11029 / RHS 1) TaxID=471855 RepID=C7N7G7_SLAHD|nr:helix-turn-helix domain-containing protein [Slackia heliotrinireducens]ACV22852.1 predicted transcriptional regulator [Slackia heliotrinireducens DSM 20476]VEH01606.1 Uncharacterized HTH-type transcriptional regulator yybR [Slackia heliotrinireducens]
MAKTPEEAQELFAKVDAVVFATARADAQPNGCIVTMSSAEASRRSCLVACVSPTMLASSLREPEEDGLVVRTMYDTMPVKVEYCLSEAGESLVPILCKLRDWAVAYRPELYTAASE